MNSALGSVRPAVSVSLANVVMEKVRDLISEGKLEPGDQVTETALADAFGVSRGPAREAMKKLTQEGLLRYERSRGTYVKELTPADVLDVYRVRGAIECAALDVLIDRGDESVFDALEAIVEDLEAAARSENWPESDRLDLHFHSTLVKRSESPRLITIFETLQLETRMCLRILRFHHPDHPEIADWHRRIVDALRESDRAEARQALLDHNVTVLDDLLVRKEDKKEK
ncbi:GntR family transcriptional regulator [Streptomyces sp. NPDC052042]|uniref:GntR family transcriptional regulator n=1 Tax=Streptomyces sp. NPDC052042 TaxID=3365683 RepID=UPI0037D5B370